MARPVFFLVTLFLLSGCSQTIHVAKVADTFEIEVHDDGTTSNLNSSTLHRDWEAQAEELCPQGYDILRHHYYKEEPFKPARIVGAVQCRDIFQTVFSMFRQECFALSIAMEGEFDLVDAGCEPWRAVPSDLRDISTATVTLSQQRATLWSLVLESRFVPCRLEQEGGGWVLLVPPGSFATAREELRLFEEANRNWPPPASNAAPLVENTLSTLSVLLLLATFHNLTRLDMPLFGHSPIAWLESGSAQAGKILDGQWWRTVTALTLHSGALHLIGNLTIGGFFIVHLCRDLGSGLAWSLLLLSGILGTLANAWFQPEFHTSIGASTLVFGAVGILAALQVVRGKSRLRRKWFLPVAGALALLAMLGTEGENTDIGAHLFGFVFGIIIGLVGAFVVEKYGRPTSRVNALLALSAAAVPVIAWWAALASGR